MSDEFNRDWENEAQGQETPQYGATQQQQYNYGVQPPMTGPIEAYKSYWRNYANFNDRTSRAGYWWVVLVNGIISIILYAVLIVPALVAGLAAASGGNPAAAVGTFSGIGILYWLWSLANLIPGLALIVRRLHDTGRSWLSILFVLIPLAGPIILLVFEASATKYPPENQYYNLPRQA